MNAAIRIDGLSVVYRRLPAVHQLSGSFETGSLTAVVGPNGAGKTSLLSAIVGQLPPAAGTIHLAPGLRGHIAYLPQQSGIDRNFPITVLDMLMLGNWSRLGSFRGAGKALRQQALAALATVGMAGYEMRTPGELSVGQFQRVRFARVLLQDASLILLDEPFNAIDAHTIVELMGLVRSWHRERRTLVAVLHNMDQVRAHFPETLLLAREVIAWGRTADVLRPENLLRARRSAERWDELAPGRERSEAAT